jgi:hypothetical protein
MNVADQVRDARLIPVVGTIFVCTVCIIAGGYFIGNFIF